MRANARSPLQKIIDGAMRQTTAALHRAGFIEKSARFSPSTPPQLTTTEGETDGVIYTIHAFTLDQDTLGDPGAQLHVEGNFKDYGS